MNRRDFLRSAGVVSAGVAFPMAERLLADVETSQSWRTFEVTTQIEVLKPAGATKVWLPAALVIDTPFQKTLSNKFSADGGSARMVERKPDGLGILAAEFPAGVKPVLTLTSRVATKNYTVDISRPALRHRN